MTPSQRAQMVSDLCRRNGSLEVKRMAPKSHIEEMLKHSAKALLEIASVVAIVSTIMIWSFV